MNKRKVIQVSIQHKLERQIVEEDLCFVVKCNFKVYGFILQEAEVGWIDKKFDKDKFEEVSKSKYISHKQLSKSDYNAWKIK